MERYAALWGVETPTNRYGCQPEWRHLLDPCGRGACGVCPGFPKLKVTGTVFVRFSNSPITKVIRSKRRGRTASCSFGDWTMHIFGRTAKNFRYFLLVFVIAITVGPVLRREFFPSEGLVPALGGWLGSLGAGGILLLIAITGGGAFLLGRSVRPRS